MNNCLLIDFGSTFTKLTAVDLDEERILATAQSETTVKTNIMDGFYLAKEKLLHSIGDSHMTFSEQLACSSAKGGFRMVAIGLSPTLTAEAAKRAALGAGTRILKVYSYGLSKEDVIEINHLSPDIILVCGGTTGGNTQGIIRDVQQLTKLDSNIPVVIAGNEEAYVEIDAILQETDLTYHFTENVMPQVNVLNPDPTREILRDIFMKQIVEAKGMTLAEQEIGKILMPTPTAVLKAAELLATGTSTQAGIGNLLIADIGGATTDIHSIGDGKPNDSNIRMEGLQEAFVKRTVEGDLGMRYSALSLLEAVSEEKFQTYLPDLSKEAIQHSCDKRANQPDFVAKTTEDIIFDETMGKLAIETAFNRHAGSYRREPTPTRTLIYQSGKDLSRCHSVIATGGILVNSQHPKEILTACLKKENENFLKPTHPDFYLDKTYLLSAMGLLAELYPDKALTLMKKYLVKL